MTDLRAVVLVEGESDRIAVHTLAARRAWDLGAAGISVIAMGGITNTFAHLQRYRDSGVTVSGLYDTAEERHLRSALDRTGIPADGFFGCDPDLEYELIRALGVDAFEAIVAGEGEARSLELLAGMPAQQGRPREEVLHRCWTTRPDRSRTGFEVAFGLQVGLPQCCQDLRVGLRPHLTIGRL